MDDDVIPDDPYELLGIVRGATTDQIKAGRRKQVKRWHPDYNKGDDRRFRAIENAYEKLTGGQDKSNHDGGSAKPEPYITPEQISWVVENGRPPKPVTVRLSNRGGPVTLVEPEPTSGMFWSLIDPTAVMTGDALYDFIITPVGIDSVKAGRYHDEIHFHVDGRVVALTVRLVVQAKSPPSPRPRATTPKPSTPTMVPLPPVSPPSPPIHGRTWNPSRNWDDVIGSGFMVLLWYCFFSEAWAGFRYWWNPAALIPVVIWLLWACFSGG